MREEQERKREEERVRKQKILEEYRLKKAQEMEEQNGSLAGNQLNSRTVVLNRQNRVQMRAQSAGTKPRPQSVLGNTSFMADFASLEQSAARARDRTDRTDSGFSLGAGTDSTNVPAAGVPSVSSSSRPQSALSSSKRTLRTANSSNVALLSQATHDACRRRPARRPAGCHHCRHIYSCALAARPRTARPTSARRSPSTTVRSCS